MYKLIALICAAAALATSAHADNYSYDKVARFDTQRSIVAFVPAPGGTTAMLANYANISNYNTGKTVDLIEYQNDDWCQQVVQMPDLNRSDRDWPQAGVITHLKQMYGVVANLGYFTPYDREVVRQLVRHEQQRCNEYLGRRSDRDARISIIVWSAGVPALRAVTSVRHEMRPNDFEELVAQNNQWCTARVNAPDYRQLGYMSSTFDTGPIARVYADLIRPTMGHHFSGDMGDELIRRESYRCRDYLQAANHF